MATRACPNMKHTVEMRINPAHNTNAVYYPFQQYNNIGIILI